MGNITLTKMLFAALICTFTVAAFFGSYSGFVILNNATIDSQYQAAFGNISAQYGEFGGVADSASDEGIVKNILDFGKTAITGTVNVFVVGLNAIGSFFEMIPIIGNVFVVLTSVFPGLAGLVGLLTTILALYVAMKYIQSVSNKQDLP